MWSLKQPDHQSFYVHLDFLLPEAIDQVFIDQNVSYPFRLLQKNWLLLSQVSLVL